MDFDIKDPNEKESVFVVTVKTQINHWLHEVDDIPFSLYIDRQMR